MNFVMCKRDISGEFYIMTSLTIMPEQYIERDVCGVKTILLANGNEYIHGKVLPLNMQGDKFCAMFSATENCFTLAQKCKKKLGCNSSKNRNVI